MRIKLEDRRADRDGAAADARRHAENAARPPAGLRLHAGRHQVPAAPMATNGEEAVGSMGNDSRWRCCRQEQAAVQLLQAAVRAGDQPADRPDPRGHRDVAEQLHRPQAQPAGHQRGQPADAPGGRAARARLRRHGRLRAIERHTSGKFKSHELDITYRWPGAKAWGRGQARVAVRRGGGRHPRRPQHPDHQRPRA